MVNEPKDSTTTVKVVCAILFVIFVVSYVYSFQGDLLAMTQNVWAEGQTHYHRGVGVAVITLTLSLLTFVVSLLTRLPKRAFALIFFPSFLFLGLLTAVNVSGGNVSTSLPWLVACPMLLVAYAIVLRLVRRYQPFMSPLRSTAFLSQPWWTNILLLVCMMIMVFAMGNTDRTLHTRLKVERLCREKQWDKALKTGFPQYDNDSSLTMLRALALANTGNMGGKLFNYEITGGAQSLAPRCDKSVIFLLGNDRLLWKTIGLVPRDASKPFVTFLQTELRRGTLNPVAKDYLLCSYLLDRDLQSFVKALPQYYAVNDSLPTHYAEAYVLYCDRYKVKDTVMSRSMVADYADFLCIMREQRSPVLRDAAIRKAYFGTYWYYYYKRKK